jgi:hypothetical protein
MQNTTRSHSQTTSQWAGNDRRQGPPPPPRFGELLVESAWRPTDQMSSDAENWFRARDTAVDRRANR